MMSEIYIETCTNKVLLIDTSYFIFYRYFATFNWYSKQLKDIDVDGLLSQKEFIDKYEKMFEKHFLDICKSCNINPYEEYNPKPKNIVFVKDCCRDSIWRNQYYDLYKATRDDKQKQFNKGIFNYTYKSVLPKIQEKYGVQIIEENYLEADDIIAILTNYLLEVVNDMINITIITNDNDYIQLLNNDNLNENRHLIIKNLQNKNIADRIGCSPKNYIEIKKILGDKSDNIPSITSKCGEKTAFKLATNKSFLDKLFETTPSSKVQYDLNTLLIDFQNIPKDLKNNVIQRIVVR